MPPASEGNQPAGPHASADRDVYLAQGNINFNQPAPGNAAKRGLGILSPPYGDLPRELRGREDLIPDLGKLLGQPDDRVHALTGLGGTGKSAIALQLANLAREQDIPVWWVDAATIGPSMLRLARALGADRDMLAASRDGDEDPSDLLWHTLEAQDGWLLVIDNADDVGALTVMGRPVRQGNGWIRGSKSGLLLVTTRDSDPNRWGHRVELHYVNYLTDEPGAQILCDLAPQAGTSMEAVELSGRLGGLPLALHHAGSYIASSLDPALSTFAGYQHALENRFPELMKSANALSDRELLTRTWELSLDQLAARGRGGARALLEVISWFAGGSPIPADRLSLTTLCGDYCLEGIDELRQCVIELKMVGLLEIRSASTGSPHSQYWVVHPLVAETTRHRLITQPRLQDSAAAAVRLLVTTLATLDSADPADWPTWQAWLPHATSLLTSTSFCIAEDQLAELNQILQKIEEAIALSGAST